MRSISRLKTLLLLPAVIAMFGARSSAAQQNRLISVGVDYTYVRISRKDQSSPWPFQCSCHQPKHQASKARICFCKSAISFDMSNRFTDTIATKEERCK